MQNGKSLYTPRAHSLDALRGFAILTMVLSGVIPYGVLPAWMYHAQLPPPEHTFNPNLPGLTWVDLVFPLFLFALGAAIPLALSRRLEKRVPGYKLVISIIERGALLAVFAILLRHVRPHVLDPQPETQHWMIALLGFVLMMLIFTRLPDAWPRKTRRVIRFCGWMGAMILLALLRYPDGSGFSPGRSDIIILVLANVYVFGSLIWLATRHRLLLRLGVLGLLLALRLAHTAPGWTEWLWSASPVPWLYKMTYLQYLFIVIPGTLVGDLLQSHMQKDLPADANAAHWSSRRFLVLVLLCISFVAVLLIGMQVRWLWQTTVVAMVMSAVGFALVVNPLTRFESHLKSLFGWGGYWLLLGLILEPFEGGIKKNDSTLSYYFITTGLAIFILIAFSIVIEVFNKKPAMQLLIDNGKNPMIAYVGFANLIWPVLALTGLDQVMISLTPTPWMGVLRGVLYTLLLAFIVQFLTKIKCIWRT
ncbi:DUF5009 domain-containing protein [candidate division KSB1 bacterium]|nr:DUF5009 domain-containing protein [candidate division KSB1 bacterium]